MFNLSSKPIAIILLVASCALSSIQATPRIIVNEIMVNEPGSETSLEWVELLNISSDSVDLSQFVFIEASDTTKFTKQWIRSRHFVVLSRKPLSSDGSASFERQWGNASGIWGDDSLETYVLLSAKMSLRNSDDSVTIVDLPSATSESARWNSSPPDGVSIERINPVTSARPQNFELCQSPKLSTPGKANSIEAPQRDLGFIKDQCSLSVPIGQNEPIRLRLAIENRGQSTITNASVAVGVDWFYDDGIYYDTLAHHAIAPVLPDSAIQLDISTSGLAGRNDIDIELSTDDSWQNNNLHYNFVIGHVDKEVLINEIMLESDSTGEWIELLPLTTAFNGLKNWILQIDSTSIEIDTTLPAWPGNYIILCEDIEKLRSIRPDHACHLVELPDWPHLPDSDGVIALRPQSHLVSDSIIYLGGIDPKQSWERDHESGSFLEMFHRSTAATGNTLCLQNSDRPPPITNDLGFVAGSPKLTKDLSDHSVIQAEMLVANLGEQQAHPVEITVFDHSAHIGTFTCPLLDPGDTTRINIDLAVTAGRHQLTFVLPPDQDPANDTVYGTMTCGAETHEIFITEFLANPSGLLESEWVEIKNISDYTIDLTGWSFGDHLNQSIFKAPRSLAAGEYAVIAQDSLAFAQFYPESCDPAMCRTWSSLNNDGDALILIDEFGTISDSLRYTSCASDNCSMELNEQGIPGIPEWSASESVSGSTPCAPNSTRIALAAVDLAISDSTLRLSRSAPDDNRVQISLIVRNLGYLGSPRKALTVAEDLNQNSVVEQGELLVRITIDSIAPAASDTVGFAVLLSTGRHHLLAVLPNDEDSSNNLAAASTTAGNLTREILITEFLANPESPIEGEWIELRNISDNPLAIQGWSIGDETHQYMIHSTTVIEPGEYAIVAQDSLNFARDYSSACAPLSPANWASLNNEGDCIILRDEFGTISDSVSYAISTDHNRSIECDESSLPSSHDWYPSTAAELSTPCAANSVSGSYSGSPSVTFLNRVFAPSAGEVLNFHIDCPPATRFTIEIFDLMGRRHRVVSDAQYYSSGDYNYDGASEFCDHLPVGAYIMKIESEDIGFSDKKGFAVAAPK